MSIKIGDKVRVTGRPETEVYTVKRIWGRERVHLGDEIWVPESWLTVVEQEPETEIWTWRPGECGIDIDGDEWVRVVGGAVCFSKANGELVNFSTQRLKGDGLTARKDPTLKFTFAWEKQ